MPELPEVETIKQELSRKIKGKKISKIDIFLPKIINLETKQFRRKIVGTKIVNIKRRGKLIIINLSNLNNLVIHLKLTGQLLLAGKSKRPQKHTHLVFYFTDNTRLFFNDSRQFGFIKLFNQKELLDFLKKENFGPEPLSKEFSLTLFKTLLLKKKKSKIKPLLMDQTFIAGVGNVYSQEACFYAKIHPGRKVGTLTEQEISDLYYYLRSVLVKAIKHKGSSVDTYVDIYGKQGEYVPFLKVYGREGDRCLRCKTKIKMIKLGGRGTYFCPKCQK